MTRMWPPGGGTRRPLAPRIAAPHEPVDPARIGRRVVRRRAKGMDVGAVAAALENARFDARQDSLHEDLADDVRGRAELAEWERITQLLAAAAPGTVYDPDTDDVVQAELAAEAAAAARETELREAARIAARADELQALRELGTLEQTEPRAGDEAACHELTRRAGGLRHYRDPAAREAAANLLTPPVLAHAALLAELTHLVPGADVDQAAAQPGLPGRRGVVRRQGRRSRGRRHRRPGGRDRVPVPAARTQDGRRPRDRHWLPDLLCPDRLGSAGLAHRLQPSVLHPPDRQPRTPRRLTATIGHPALPTPTLTRVGLRVSWASAAC